MIGYTDRDTRCSGSRHRLECCSTPAPRPGYMFSMAPIHMPITPVRMSPKYFQVSDSEVSGSAAAAGLGVAAGGALCSTGCDARSADVVGATVITSPVWQTWHNDNCDNRCCLHLGGRVAAGLSIVACATC